MSMTCYKFAGGPFGDGIIDIVINGNTSTTGCQVATPTSRTSPSINTTCNIEFDASDIIGAHTKQPADTTSNCAVAWWVRYD